MLTFIEATSCETRRFSAALGGDKYMTSRNLSMEFRIWKHTREVWLDCIASVERRMLDLWAFCQVDGR